MNTYEFSAKVSDGVLIIPQEYIAAMPLESDVRVILVVDEESHDGPNHSHRTLDSDAQSLEALVAEIQKIPSKPENFTPAGDKLAELLAAPPIDPEPDFNADQWNKEWAVVEAKMKAGSLAHEQDELDALSAQ